MNRAEAGHDRTVLISAFNNKIFGVNRQNGQLLWQVELGAGYGPTVDIAIIDNVVVAVCGATLSFIEYRTGRVYKEVKLAGEPSSRPTLLIDGQHVYVASDGELGCYTSAGDLVWFQPFKGHGHGTMALGLPGNIRQADSLGSR
jgi:outer membrane protein assembly factor BamB